MSAKSVCNYFVTADRVLAAFLIEGRSPSITDPAEGPANGLLTPEQVADWLQVKVETLATWRCTGRGPGA